jgi:ankyrin repeat protein
VRYLSLNPLCDYGRQAYSICTSFRDRTIGSCHRIAERAWDEMDEKGMPLVYRFAPPRLFNVAFRLLAGVSMEESKNKELHLAACWGTTRDVEAILAKGADVNVKNWVGMTPLHYTARKGNSEGCRVLLNRGADIEAKNNRGRTPLHQAAMYGNADAVHTLLNAGASNVVKTPTGHTPLHLAVYKGNKEAVQALVAAGADIYAKDSKNCTPSDYSDNIEIIRILFDFESHPAFASLTTLHDYCDKIFPASRDRLPKDWETWVKKIKSGKDPFQELREVLAKCGEISFKKNMKTLETLQATSSSSPSLESIVQCLIQESPVFAKAWALVNRDEKLKLIEISEPDQKNDRAYYNCATHAIHIPKWENIFEKTHSIVFEVMNAFQRETFLQIDQLVAVGNLSREEFTFLAEATEYTTLCWTHRIAGMPPPYNYNFTKYWKRGNTPDAPSKIFPKGKSPHADTYRKQWDLHYAVPYLKKHPELDIALRKSRNPNQKTSSP